jgi:hypothetical protein
MHPKKLRQVFDLCWSLQYTSMMTVEKTQTFRFESSVDIPADGHLHLDLPNGFPKGRANIKLTVKPVGKKPIKTFTDSLGDLYGCLKNSSTFAGDPVEIQRKMRDEWPD